MNRTLIFVPLTILVLSACSHQHTTQLSGQSTSPTSGGGGGPSLASAAAKLTNACSLVPANFAQKLVPGASTPESEQFPLRCTLRNGKASLHITFDTGPDEPVKGAEFISGLAGGGYLERLDPGSRGDTYLTVILGKDLNGTNRNLHVGVASQDGTDHKDDAIAIARDVLARLH